MHGIVLFHWLVQNRLLTWHNQENGQWSPDPFPCERVWSGHKTPYPRLSESSWVRCYTKHCTGGLIGLIQAGLHFLLEKTVLLAAMIDQFSCQTVRPFIIETSLQSFVFRSFQYDHQKVHITKLIVLGIIKCVSQ